MARLYHIVFKYYIDNIPRHIVIRAGSGRKAADYVRHVYSNKDGMGEAHIVSTKFMRND